jgi:hypothetical protein
MKDTAIADLKKQPKNYDVVVAFTTDANELQTKIIPEMKIFSNNLVNNLNDDFNKIELQHEENKTQTTTTTIYTEGKGKEFEDIIDNIFEGNKNTNSPFFHHTVLFKNYKKNKILVDFDFLLIKKHFKCKFNDLNFEMGEKFIGPIIFDFNKNITDADADSDYLTVIETKKRIQIYPNKYKSLFRKFQTKFKSDGNTCKTIHDALTSEGLISFLNSLIDSHLCVNGDSKKDLLIKFEKCIKDNLKRKFNDLNSSDLHEQVSLLSIGGEEGFFGQALYKVFNDLFIFINFFLSLNKILISRIYWDSVKGNLPVKEILFLVNGTDEKDYKYCFETFKDYIKFYAENFNIRIRMYHVPINPTLLGMANANRNKLKENKFGTLVKENNIDLAASPQKNFINDTNRGTEKISKSDLDALAENIAKSVENSNEKLIKSVENSNEKLIKSVENSNEKLIKSVENSIANLARQNLYLMLCLIILFAAQILFNSKNSPA